MRVFVKKEIIDTVYKEMVLGSWSRSGAIVDAVALDAEPEKEPKAFIKTDTVLVQLLKEEIEQLLYNQGNTREFVAGYFAAKGWGTP